MQDCFIYVSYILFHDHRYCIISEHVAYVEAKDGAGKKSQAKIRFVVLDANDSPPKFKKRSYQGFMNSDKTRLRNDVQVEVKESHYKEHLSNLSL